MIGKLDTEILVGISGLKPNERMAELLRQHAGYGFFIPKDLLSKVNIVKPGYRGGQ